MLDTVIQNGWIIDGLGGEPYRADLGIQDGRIVQIGKISETAKETLDADEHWVTPGFIDLHTHYDGQATWDTAFIPSIYHGITTLVMGNCGVGFAPVRKGEEERLIELMEGVEDIPGVALAEGVKWNWQSFPEYMSALEKTPRSLDYLVQVPHDPLRMFVMGARAKSGEIATDTDIAMMQQLLDESLRAGAIGFSTGRSDNHRTSRGQATPASESNETELTALAEVFKRHAHGVIQIVNDFDVLRKEDRLDAEFDLIEAMAKTANKPLSMTWMQRDPGATQHERVQKRVEQARAKGLSLYMQSAPRGIGVVTGLDTSLHLFMGCPAYQEVASMPLEARAAALREPQRKQRVLSEPVANLAQDGNAVSPLVDILRAQIERISARMFPLAKEGKINYEPPIHDSFYVKAKTKNINSIEAIYDYLTEGAGDQLIYFPIFNYNEGNLNIVRQMFSHPYSLLGLSDAGAHVGTICDVSFSTFVLTYWVQALGKAGDPRQLGLAQAIQLLSKNQADYLGLSDRGTLQTGLRADINVIDPAQLAIDLPQLQRDLPAQGKRFVQRARGYVGTWVAGERVICRDEITNNKPGKLIRMK